MLRTILLCAAVGIAASGCNVCNRIYNADMAANEKGKDCGANSNSSVDLNRCYNGLGNCSANDIDKLNNYADCLEKLPVCSSGQSFSWSLQRLGCIQALSGISGNCLQAFN
jgi:hypothetical protein